MRGVIKKRKHFQFFLKKNYIFVIFIKIIFFCFKLKNFFFFKNINFFLCNIFSYVLCDTFFFLNGVFLNNIGNLPILSRDFFYTKKKLKKISRDKFIFFFKKFLKKRGGFRNNTIFNKLQTQKLSDNGVTYVSRWVRVYRNYINIFSLNHKLRLVRRIFFKRRWVRDFGVRRQMLYNWPVLKQFYEANEWVNAAQAKLIPTTTLFLLTYYSFFQKKKFFFDKKKLFFFNQHKIYLSKPLKQFFYLNKFFNFFYSKQIDSFTLLQQIEVTELYFNHFFKKKNFFKNTTSIGFNKDIFFYFKRFFYIYNYCFGIFTRFSIS